MIDQPLPHLKPVENVTLREQVTQSLRTALMRGHFQPGQSVTVKAISTMLGASVMPAREAMTRLTAEGALELRPNRTVIVPVLSSREFDEVTDLRCHVEAVVAAQAVDHVRPEHINELRLLDSLMRAAAKRGDIDEYLNSNFKFHFVMYRLGSTPFVLSIIEKLWVRVGPLIRESIGETGFSDSGKVHAEMIDALRAGNKKALQKAVAQDISFAATSIKKSRAGCSN